MFVYIVAQEDHSQPWKIGRTTNPEQRLKQLQAHSPVKLVYVQIIEANPALESSIHRQFAHARSHGEWFHLTEDLIPLVLMRLEGEPWVQTQRPQGKRPYGRNGTRKKKQLPKVSGGRGFRLDGLDAKLEHEIANHLAIAESKRLFG